MEGLPEDSGRLDTRWGIAWVGLALALALHVLDEALSDFLSFYNPIAEALRQWLPVPFPPIFTFDVWLGGLIAGVLLLLALSWCAFRGFAWMRPLSYVLGALMLLNGLAHLTASLTLGRVVAGSYSSPVLIAAATDLLVATPRRTA